MNIRYPPSLTLIFTLVSLKRQVNEAWEPTNNAMLFQNCSQSSKISFFSNLV